MMEIMSFSAKWINWLKSCLESSSISVQVNGSSNQKFKPSKGRQHDLLVLLLFLIVVETLGE